MTSRPVHDDNLLAGIGFEAAVERTYRVMVTLGAVAEVAAVAGDPVRETGHHVDALFDAGLVSRSVDDREQLVVTRPDLTVGRLVVRQHQLESARSALAGLQAEYGAGIRRRDAGALVEIVTGSADVRQVIRDVQLDAVDELMELAGAQTRTQLAWLAAHRGWLTDQRSE